MKVRNGRVYISAILPKVDILTVRDPTLHATTPICHSTQASTLFLDKHVIVLAPWHFGAFET